MKKSLYFSPGLAFLVIVGLFLFLVRPKINEILDIQQKLKDETGRLSRLTEKASFLENQDTGKLKEDVGLSNLAIPSEKDVPYFLTSLDLLSKDASVSVISVQTSPGKISTESGKLAPEDEVIGDTVGKVSLDLVIEGTFDGLKMFLTKMSSTFPLQSVNSISFSRRGKGEEIFGTVSATFSLFVHYQFLPKSLGKVSDPIEKISSAEEKILSLLSGFPKPQVNTNFIQTGKADPFSPL